MKKEYVIFIGAALVLLLVIGGGYQFYLKPTAALLKEKKQEYQRYDAKLQELEERYGGYVPRDVVAAWKLQLQPWFDTINAREDLFGLGRIEYEEVPTNTLPKFHYAEQYTAMLEELSAEALEKGINLPALNFDVPGAQIEGTTMSKEEVEENLRQIAVGCSLVRLLLDQEPLAIQAVRIWPTRFPSGRLEAISAGYAFSMRLNAFADFVDDVCTRERYASIDSFSITNQNLLEGDDPVLLIQMVVTQATYEPIEQETPEALMAKADEKANEQTEFLEMLKNRPVSDREDMRRKPPTWWQRFRKKYLPF